VPGRQRAGGDCDFHVDGMGRAEGGRYGHGRPGTSPPASPRRAAPRPHLHRGRLRQEETSPGWARRSRAAVRGRRIAGHPLVEEERAQCSASVLPCPFVSQRLQVVSADRARRRADERPSGVVHRRQDQPAPAAAVTRSSFTGQNLCVFRASTGIVIWLLSGNPGDAPFSLYFPEP